MSDAEWRSRLSPEAYRVLRRKGTERPFSGRYAYETGEGVYRCRGCGRHLFDSSAKYDSGCGWPAFTEPVTTSAVEERLDASHFMVRTEITCSSCDGHLGHVFRDGPKPGGLRYCINSAALDLQRRGRPLGDGHAIRPDGDPRPDAGQPATKPS